MGIFCDLSIKIKEFGLLDFLRNLLDYNILE